LASALESKFKLTGDVARFNSADDDNFTQPGIFWSKVGFYSLRGIFLQSHFENFDM
jgi:hypothetical protein